MNEHSLPRFAAAYAAKDITISCNGLNHSDRMRPGMCLGCGKGVARATNGALFDIVTYRTPAGYERTAVRCYKPAHTCDPEIEVRYMRFWNDALAEGKIMHDQHVTVVKGRKVPQGTEGTVFYRVKDEDFHGNEIIKIGIRTADDVTFFVQESYVQATHTIPIISAEEAAALDPEHADEYLDEPVPVRVIVARRQGSHAECSHEATKSARAACRKARA